MLDNSEFVLEFVVHNIVCKNTTVRSSPLVVSLPGCPDVTLNAKSATVCKITYERGKRVSFSHAHLLNLKASFVLIQGHGDQTIRASCSFDFFEIVSSADEQIPTVYDVEIGMDRPGGDRFGIMSCTFQLMPAYEFQTTSQVYPSSRPTSARVPKASTSTKRISVSRQTETPRERGIASARGTPKVPESNLKTPLSSRSAVSSIHERYMKRNEMWIGHHCSTHSESENMRSRFSSRTSSRQSRDPY